MLVRDSSLLFWPTWEYGPIGGSHCLLDSRRYGCFFCYREKMPLRWAERVKPGDNTEPQKICCRPISLMELAFLGRQLS